VIEAKDLGKSYGERPIVAAFSTRSSAATASASWGPNRKR
jgi:hypothetical protein